MLTLENIGIQYEEKMILSGVSLSLNKGEIGCLLGESGCGKTSILRAIAGFKDVFEGTIEIAGNKVSQPHFMVEVAKRKVGIVFQDYALFPHMTVHQNIQYGLPDQDDISGREIMTSLVEMVGLQNHLDKLPHELSGGQQQRVAIARALVSEPDLLLLDEPFSSLDPEMRSSIAEEVRNIIKQRGITALLITHDQQEAFTVADKIGVLHNQTCHQWSDSVTLYHKPNTKYIAKFIGEGCFIQGSVTKHNDSLLITTALGAFSIPDHLEMREGSKLEVLVRPDDIIHDDNSAFKAEVIGRTFRGASILFTLRLNHSKQTLLCLAPSHHNHKIGEKIGIRLELEHVICFEYTDITC